MGSDAVVSPLSPHVPPLLPSYTWAVNHQYESIQPASQPEAHDEEPKSQTLDSTATAPEFVETTLSWRPFYLQRFVLAAFVIVFVLIIVAIEVLLAVSNKNEGIASSDPSLHYLWTYGPTAFLILVAALWSRVEYQSKLVAPWARLSRHPADASRTLLLDYTSDFYLYALYKSLRNRDFTVSIATGISSIIKILIVISTGLITLSWTGITHGSRPMVVQDKFVDDGTGLSGSADLSWFVMKGLIEQNLTFPEGMSKDYAFQSVRTDLPGVAETRYTVDGLSSTLDCQPVELNMTGAKPPDPRTGTATMNLTITSAGCSMQNLRIPAPVYTALGKNSSNALFARFEAAQCDGTNNDAGKRVLVMFGNLTYTKDYTKNTTDYTGSPTHPYVGVLHRSTQMLCLPTYGIKRVEVVRNGTRTLSLTESPGTSSRQLDSVSAWDIMNTHFKSFSSFLADAGSAFGKPSINVSMVPVDVDDGMSIALPLLISPNTTVASFFDSNFLQGFATDYWKQYSAVLAKQTLMKPASIDIVGFAKVEENRLVVRNWAAQWMVGLVAACFVLGVVMLFTTPKHGLLPRDPGSIPGMASLVLHSHNLLTKLRFSGAASDLNIANSLQPYRYHSGVIKDPASGQNHFSVWQSSTGLEDGGHGHHQIAAKPLHPSILHPASRLITCIVLIGLIITLELLLHKSDSEDGLGDVGNDEYIHYTWTTLPALVFGILAMVISSMDFKIRSLAPYLNLRNGVNTNAITSLNFLDMSLPRLVSKEVSMLNFEALAMTSALFLASLFTIFSGSLFQALSVPAVASITLRANQSFDLTPWREDEADITSSLILESNLSFPRFTYGDLAFPELVPVTLPSVNSSFNVSAMSIQTVVPAVRGRLDCRQYDSSMIRTNLTLNYTIKYSNQNPLMLYIKGEECKLDKGKHEDLLSNIIISTYPNATYFARGFNTDAGTDVQGCSDLLYAWGKFDWNSDHIIQNVNALGCNVTFEVVDVDTTFVGPDLEIDTQTPPQTREETARNTTIVSSHNDISAVSLIYAGLTQMKTDPQLLDTFFGLVTTSRWAVPISALGDPSATNTVVDAIKTHHGIIQAQQLSQQRVPASQSNATITNPKPTDNDAQPVYNATSTDTSGRRRVVQDAVSTRILDALIAAALLLLILSWFFTPETDVLPRSPTTIASVVALIAGGNILELLPPDAEWRSTEEIAWALGPGTRFYMGWGKVPDTDGKMYGGENEGGLSRFGIFAMKADEQHTAYQGPGGEPYHGDQGDQGQGNALMSGHHGDEM